jgi:hypothetical protein
MPDSTGSSRKNRQYPSFWEKGVPILLGVLGAGLFILLIIILAVATGLIGIH